MRKLPTWVLVLAGVFIVIVCIGIAAVIATTAWVQQNLAIETTTEADATTQFDQVRQKFSDGPLLEIRGDRPVYSGKRTPPASPPRLERLHVLVWDPSEERRLSFSLPFWFLRLKSGPIALSSHASGMDDLGVNLSPEELEKYGPGIVLDTTSGDGERVLIWTE